MKIPLAIGLVISGTWHRYYTSRDLQHWKRVTFEVYAAARNRLLKAERKSKFRVEDV